MRVFVRVKTKKKEEKIKKVDENHFLIFVKEAPEKGKANRAILKILGDYFKIPASKLKIIAGITSKNKTIEFSDK